MLIDALEKMVETIGQAALYVILSHVHQKIKKDEP